jgi:hypothetical protein
VDEPLSNFAFEFNLRHCTMVWDVLYDGTPDIKNMV